jgi:hypothetical protein
VAWPEQLSFLLAQPGSGLSPQGTRPDSEMAVDSLAALPPSVQHPEPRLEEGGLCIPLDWHLRRGFDAADLSREMVARFKRPFDQKMFESFRYGVQSVFGRIEAATKRD